MIINKIKKMFGKRPGRQVVYVPSDRQHGSESRDMDMEKIDAIMQSANCGEPSRLYQLAEEIYDKNWDIRQALSTRFSAINGKPWTIEPASKNEFDLQVALDLKRELISAGAGAETLVSFKDVLRSLVFGIYSGVSATEIVWSPGGSFAGFSPIVGRTLTFRDNFYRPKLNTNTGLMELPADKYIIQIARGVSGDPARGGLVRILAYLHCFSNVQVKYLLRFVERYGMPFTVAKVDDKTWETERNVIKDMIQNFGPDGGGVFSRGTEFELMQAANNTGDVYFKLLQYLGDAVTKIVLGQLASSSVSSGLSGGDAQSQVRQDILEDDCSIIETTVNTRIFPIWVKLNYGADVKCPIFKINFNPAEDLAAFADLIVKLDNAGLAADPVEMSAKFGLKLVRKVMPPVMQAAPAMQPSQGLALAEEPVSGKGQVVSAGIDKWAAPMIGKINAALDSDDGINKLGGLSFEDFNGAILEDFLGSSAVTAAAAGKADAASKIEGRMNRRIGESANRSLKNNGAAVGAIDSGFDKLTAGNRQGK